MQEGIIKFNCKWTDEPITIEQKVIELQNLKKDLADRIIMEDDQHIEKLEDDDLKYLLS